MCVPKAPAQVSTIQQVAPLPQTAPSATNLQLGGQLTGGAGGSRGSALLGRLMLRVGNASSGAQSTATQSSATPPGAIAQQPGKAAPAPGSPNPAAAPGFAPLAGLLGLAR